MKKLPISIYIAIFLFINLYIIIPRVFAQANPASNNYKVQDYGFGGGGVATSSSNGYSIFGASGETDAASASSANYTVNGGLAYEVTASESAAPTFTNPSNYYNKLHITINKDSGDPYDSQYAIQVSTESSFVTQSLITYVQSNHTISASLSNSNWLKYPAWGDVSGIDIIGLTPGTTYYARVATRQGQYFTQSAWSPIATAATINPTFSFTLSTNNLTMGTLTPATVNSSSTVTTQISTNGTGGGTVYIYSANAGLKSSSTSDSINSSTADLGVATIGYGAQGTSVSQVSGGPMEIVSPYNGNVATDNVGVLDTTNRIMFDSTGAPVTTGQGIFKLKVKPSNITKAATDYTDTLTVIASAVF